jgi:hypothetical protein
VTWRMIVGATLFYPMLAVLLAPFAILLVWKAPMLCCSRWRRVRYLPIIGITYFSLLVPLIVVAAGLGWWETLILIGMAVFVGNWLLPDPFTFLFRPHNRQAILRAIEHVEASHQVIYDMASVIGKETGRTIVSVSINSSCIPAPRRFVAIGKDGTTVEELDYAYVAEKHGVRPMF